MKKGHWWSVGPSTADNDMSRASPQSTASSQTPAYPGKERNVLMKFKFTCLEEMPESIINIKYDELWKKGLGIPASELVDGKRVPTRIPSNWTILQMRQKVLKMFPRLRTFQIYKGVKAAGVIPITSRTVRGLKKEINRSCVYIVPDSPLAPLGSDVTDSVVKVSDSDSNANDSDAKDSDSDAKDSDLDAEDSNSDAEDSDSDVLDATTSLIHEGICIICHRSGEVLCCNICRLAFHIHCLDPPITTKPVGSWCCPQCTDHMKVSQPEYQESIIPATECAIRDCCSREWSDKAMITYHTFPKDEETAKRWIDFVRYTQKDFEHSPSSVLCSKHFNTDSFFKKVPHLSEHMYFSQKLCKLRSDAIPTILYAHKAEEAGYPVKSGGESSEESGADYQGKETRGEMKRMAAATKQTKNMLHFVKLTDINAYITCFLCGGYMFNATTITECLHSFCRKCILQHFQKDNTCPNCDMLIHESIPFHYIRQDGLLQMIINKLLPSFESIEKEAEKKSPDIPPPTRPASPAPLIPTAETVPIYSKTVSSVQMSLQLEYMGASSDCPPITPLEKSFVRVSSQATIRHVQKFISHKLHLGDEFEVDIICGEEILQPAVILYNLKREVEKEQIIDNILVLSYSLGLAQ